MYTLRDRVYGHGFEDSYAIWEVDQATTIIPFVKPLPATVVTYTRLNREPLERYERTMFYLKPAHNLLSRMTFGTYLLEPRDETATMIFWSFTVHAWFQSHGIGRFLLDCAVRQTQFAGYSRLVLFVDNRNWRAMRLYRRYGFDIEKPHSRLQWNLRCVYELPDGG